jgi:PAS domain S-box-containing protein
MEKITKKELTQYKKIIDESSIVSKSDLKGTITHVNQKLCEISGYTKEELLGKNHNIFRHDNMPKEAFVDLWKTIQAKKTWHGIIENRAKNGNSYFVRATVMPILDEDEKIVEYISLREDITELKKHQLQDLNTAVDDALDVHWEQTVQYIPAPTVIIDNNSMIKFHNSLFESEFYYYKHNKQLANMFTKNEGFIYSDGIFDWKDIVLNSDFTSKVIVNQNSIEKEYVIAIAYINLSSLYVVSFYTIENDL